MSASSARFGDPWPHSRLAPFQASPKFGQRSLKFVEVAKEAWPRAATNPIAIGFVRSSHRRWPWPHLLATALSDSPSCCPSNLRLSTNSHLIVHRSQFAKLSQPHCAGNPGRPAHIHTSFVGFAQAWLNAHRIWPAKSNLASRTPPPLCEGRGPTVNLATSLAQMRLVRAARRQPCPKPPPGSIMIWPRPDQDYHSRFIKFVSELILLTVTREQCCRSENDAYMAQQQSSSRMYR